MAGREAGSHTDPSSPGAECSYVRLLSLCQMAKRRSKVLLMLAVTAMLRSEAVATMLRFQAVATMAVEVMLRL